MLFDPRGCKWGQIFILDNAGLFGLSSLSGLSGLSGFFSLFGPGEIDFIFHGINLFGLQEALS